ncbi:hypothetical protein GQ44DRAFT_623397 [Phaeosphaeriaceae sp. PMI808]|nr:hypothetical protein GQ44DRAFT_623397 [Phaeosphaeriaceae sp. PMI808]
MFFILRKAHCFPALHLFQSGFQHIFRTPSTHRISKVRWQGTKAASKSVFYRASGFGRGISEKDVWRIIKRNLGKDEGKIPADITVLPACDSGRDDSAIAIIKFPSNQQPNFLAELLNDPLGEKIVRYENDNGILGHVVFDRHFHGFTQLYPTSDAEPVRADIVAITGMDGHAYGSWMSREGNSAMWLRDFLAHDLPDCRTMIYGYHSKLLASNMNELKEYGRLFLADIEKIRDTVELQRRPLIFICHSYGGVLLSHCLVRASTLEEESRRSLYKSCYGMLFFGTPHRGSPKDDILKMVEQPYPNRVPALMQTAPDSGELKFQLQLFSDLVRDRQIGSFYETEPTPAPSQAESGEWRRAGQPVLQVSEVSATLQFPGFRERKIPVNANHTNMVKFGSRVNPTYTTVLRMLREFVRDAPKIVSRRYEPIPNDTQKKTTVPFHRSVNLYGRSDFLARLEEKFDSTSYHCRAALTGLGGIGKSAIAIKFAQNHFEKYPHKSIFWVHSSTAARFSQSYREVADALRIEGRDEPKVDILKLVCDHLSDEKNGSWLMVLDNADGQAFLSMDHALQNESTSYYRPLSSFLPQGAHGSILITSRDRSLAEDLVGSIRSTIPVYALDEVDSIQLLRERSGDDISPDEDAVELVKSLDNHALAITQAAAFIYNGLGRMNITRYLSLYRKALKNQQPEILLPQAVSITWQLSFDTIRKSYPYSFKLLSLMSLLHFDDIPDFLFIENTPRYEADKSLFEKDIAPLLRFSLIVLDGDKFDMHRLVQYATRSWLLANHEMHQRVREARVLIAEAFPDISAGFEHWEKCQALLPHAEATLSLDAGPENLRQRRQRGKILYNIAYFEYIKGDHAAALQHFVTAKQVQSEFLKDDDKQLVLTKTMVFRMLWEMGQSEEAIHQVNSELSDLHRRRPDSIYSNEYLALLEERARIMLDDGHWDTAEIDARKALRLMMTRDGVSEVHKLDAKRTLARAISFQGEPEQAEPLLREVLKRREQLWSVDHVDTLKSVLDLAQCLANQGRYEEAEKYFETASVGLQRFPSEETTRAEKIKTMWEEARRYKKQRGLPLLQRKLHRSWRQVKLRMFGSTRTSLTTIPNVRSASGWWRYLFFVSILSGLWLLEHSSQERIQLLRWPERLREEIKGHHQQISRQLEDNEAIDRDQNETLKRLEKEIQEVRAKMLQGRGGGT